MNRVSFGEEACEKTRKYLDSYINNELLLETNHEVHRHLERCQLCSQELDTLTKLRARLKAAVKTQAPPVELEARIRTKIRTRRTDTAFSPRWALAVAAAVLVTVGIWSMFTHDNVPALADRPAQNAYIQKISTSLASILKVGLGDHLHCSVFRKYPKNPPPVEQMEKDLGPAYQGMLPVVRAAIPKAYRVVMAHQCSYLGRKYIHITFEHGGELVSLVVTSKTADESMANLSKTSQRSEVPIYQAAADHYQIAGFEAGQFLAYVVSDLKAADNLHVASNLAPIVRDFLVKTNG